MRSKLLTQHINMTHHKAVLAETVKNWLPLAVTIIIFTGLVAVAVQQNYRMSANDPQIQIAEDVSTAINNGSAAPDAIVSPTPTSDIAASLSAFVTVFSSTTTPIGSSVALNGKLPTLPAGVFSYVNAHGEDRFTWQPQPGLRIAAVVTKYGGAASGYVLAGRSLRDIEVREGQLNIMAAVAGVLALLLSFLIMWWNTKKLPHHQHHEEEAKPSAE
jgi:hypothetical protein